MKRAIAPAVIFVVAFVSVIMAQRDQGVSRDETVYVTHGQKYASWWRGLISTDIGSRLSKTDVIAHFGEKDPKRKYFKGNAEHPPLVKTMMGMSIWFWHDKVGACSKITASRIPAALFFAGLILLVFLFGRQYFDVWVGAAGALFLATIPRFFFHAGFANFDVAIAFFWFAAIYAYSRSLTSLRWAIATGLIVGAALATKHNAIMLPGVIGLHMLWLAFRYEVRFGLLVSRESRSWQKILIASSLFVGTLGLVAWLSNALAAAIVLALAAIAYLAVMAIVRSQDVLHKPGDTPRRFFPNPAVITTVMFLAPVTLFVMWPVLWFKISHISDWIGFHLHHVHYNFEYLGENLNHPPFPWHVPLVTLWATVPLPVLLCAALGVGSYADPHWRAKWRSGYRPLALLNISLVVAWAVFFRPSTPVFGVEKHWFAVLPSLVLMAGLGIRYIVYLAALVLRFKYVQPVLSGMLIALVTGVGLAETVAARPFGLTHYVAQVGGPRGAATMGMNRQFWGYAARQAAPYLNTWADAQHALRVYGHDADVSFGPYRDAEIFRETIRHSGREDSGIKKSQVALVIHEKHFNRHDYLIWRYYGTFIPSVVLTHYGVPVVSIYRRPTATAKPTK